MKKILTSLLLAVLIFSSVPKNVNAEMTVAEIMAQIAALQAQLAQMQGQPTVPTPTGGGSGGGGVMSTCPTFSRSLTIGSTGADVTNLQKFLMAKGYLSQENISGYFGPLTQDALARYQSSKNITPATGYFGPLTIATVNADCGNTTSSAKIRLLSPNGGEMLNEGENFTIKWESFNLPVDSKIRLIVSKGDKLAIGNRNKEIVDLPSSFNSYTWKVEAYSDNGNGWGVGKISVPEKIAKLLGIPSANADVVNNQYIIHIGVINKEGDKSIAGDSSDKPFTIFRSNVFKIIDPESGSKLVAGRTYPVNWIGSNPEISSYEVILVGKNNDNKKIGTAYPRADGTVGTFSWTVPTDLKPSTYQIKLVSPLNEKNPAVSGKFSVVSYDEQAVNFQITFPNAGTGLIAGRTHRILWSGWDYYKDAKVKQYSVYLVGGKLGSNGSQFLGTVDLDKQDWFEWKIPADLATASNYQIQFSGVGATGDNSDNFSIVSSDDYAQIDNVKVLYNGSQVSQIITGNKYTIVWDEKNTSSSLKTKVGLNWLNSNREWVSVYEIGSVSGSGSGKNSIVWSVPPDLKIFDGRYQVYVEHPGAGGSQEVQLSNQEASPRSSISISSPNSADLVTIGSKVKVEWTTVNIPTTETFLIRLRSVSTGREYNLVSGVLNDQSENVVISPTLPEGYYKLEMKSSKSVIGRTGTFKIISPTTTQPKGLYPALVSTNVDVTTGTSANDDVGLFSIKYKLKAVGGDYYIPASIGAVSYIVDKAGAMISPSTISSTLVNITDDSKTVSGNYVIKNGEEETFEFTTSVPMGGTNTAGQYRLSINGFRWRDTDNAGTPNILTAGLENFKTNYQVLNYGDRATQLANIQATINSLLEALKSLPN